MIEKIKKIMFDSNYRFALIISSGITNMISDETFLKRLYKIKMGRELDLKKPLTYNEKLQWLKLYDRKSIYTTMVDKYEAKKYVASKIGEEYIIPTLGVWERFDDIVLDSLPDKFVLKCTHDSGGLIICKDKNQLDCKVAKKKIEKCLKQNYYWSYREWPYKNVRPRIIAEQYMGDNSKSELCDYKIYTFNGKARMCMINQDRGTHTRADYFDKDFNWLDFKWGYDHADVCPEKPQNYDLMYELAEKLATGTYELRVDFYEVNGQVYFGEMTFFDGAGFDKIVPESFDRKFGDWIKLPQEKD